MESKPTYYIVCTAARFRELFPFYKGNDERRSTDGRVLCEVKLDSMKSAELLLDDSIGLFNHEQVLEFLDSEPEKWGGKKKESKEYTRKQLEGMRKSQLVELAEAKGTETEDKSKEELIDGILRKG